MATFLGSSLGGNLNVVILMGYSFWLTAAVRNKQMHVLNGNSPSAPFLCTFAMLMGFSRLVGGNSVLIVCVTLWP